MKNGEVYYGVHCTDCSVEGFRMLMVEDSLWAQITNVKEDALCISCMENRLGRTIQQCEIPDIFCNTQNWWLNGDYKPTLKKETQDAIKNWLPW